MVVVQAHGSIVVVVVGAAVVVVAGSPVVVVVGAGVVVVVVLQVVFARFHWFSAALQRHLHSPWHSGGVVVVVDVVDVVVAPGALSSASSTHQAP